MIDIILDWVSWTLVLIGGFFMLVGGIGVLRLPDFFTRQHAAGITDTMGANLILIALMLQVPFGLITAKIFFVLGFLFLTSPTASHALAQAAISTGNRPLGTDLRQSQLDKKPAAAPPDTVSAPQKEDAPSTR